VVGRLTKGVGALFKKNEVQHIEGQAVLRNGTTLEVAGQTLEAGHIILATGARARSLPSLPIDGEVVLTSREALERKDLPASVVIVGGGATGCEFADIYHAYGVQVTIVELLPHLLPNEDEEVSVALERSFTNRGVTLLLGARVTGLARSVGADTVPGWGGTGERQLARARVLWYGGGQGTSPCPTGDFALLRCG